MPRQVRRESGTYRPELKWGGDALGFYAEAREKNGVCQLNVCRYGELCQIPKI